MTKCLKWLKDLFVSAFTSVLCLHRRQGAGAAEQAKQNDPGGSRKKEGSSVYGHAVSVNVESGVAIVTSKLYPHSHRL